METTTSVPVKRGRGRPRKNPIVAASAPITSTAETVVAADQTAPVETPVSSETPTEA